MATVWKNVRIRQETHARLCAVIVSLRRAAEMGQYETTSRHLVDVSLDDAIVSLLNKNDNHRERVKRAQRKKTQANVHNVDTPPSPEG